MTINTFKKIMTEKAQKKGGIWENFGQNELSKLKDKYGYNPYANQWSEKKEREVKEKIDELDKWAMTFNLN